MSIPVQDEIRAMMYDGLSNKEIAKRTGFGRSTISGYRRKWNLPPYKKLRKAPITAKYMVNSRRVHQSDTLCWSCVNAVPDSNGHGCPWSRDFEPVEGWDAKPDRYVSNRMGKRVMVNSYEVKRCPLFERG